MIRAGFALAAMILASSVTVWAGDWPEFHGAERNGVSDNSNPPTEWGPGKNVKWKAELPEPGNSSPIVSGGRVFLTCAQDGHGYKRALYCFDRVDGKQLWMRTVDYEKEDPSHQRNPYCASSPAADGTRVVVWHGSAGVHCYDYAGKELWSRDLGTFRHIWGYASSPVFYGDSIILNCGPGERSFVVALDKNNGQILWQTDEPGGAEDKNSEGKWVGSWATPLPVKVDGQDQILVPQSHHVNAYDPKTGKIIWTFGGAGDLAYEDVMAGDGVAVVASGYGGPAEGFKLGGSGDVTESNRLWRAAGRNPQRIGTGVVIGPNLFMVNEPGLSCIEIASGRELWNHREPGQTFWGSAVLANDRLYVTSQRGVTFVYAADPKEYRQIATNDLHEPTNSTPAISDGEIFLRTSKSLFCIGSVDKAAH